MQKSKQTTGIHSDAHIYARVGRAVPIIAALIQITVGCSFVASTPSPTLGPGPAQAQIPTIQIVTVKTGIDVTQPTQSPRYFLDTGNGHYLLYVIETKKLIYDGQEVYSGDLSGLGSGGMALSDNGLHDAYVTESSSAAGFNDLFIDGAKTVTAKYLSQPAVTDDGRHYFYTACNNPSGITDTCLFKDGKDIFLHGDGILDLWISNDGATNYASLRNMDSSGSFVESLVRNGEEIYKGTELAGKAFSQNGQHYAYVTVDPNTKAQNLVVDGQTKHSSSALLLQQITDPGSYCAWDSAQKKVYVNNTEFPVKQDAGIRCYINQDASYSLIYDDGWFLDGQAIQLADVKPGDVIWQVEMTEHTWFVYRLVN